MLVDMADRCARRCIELLIGGDFNMVMREQDIGTVSEDCLVAINSFAAAVGIESAFIDRFPQLEDRRTVYTYSWQDGGTSTSLIDHLFADAQHVLAVGIARHDGRLDSDHRMVLCDYRLEGKVSQGAQRPRQLPGHIFDRVFDYSLKKLKHYRPARSEWAVLTARIEELATTARWVRPAGYVAPNASAVVFAMKRQSCGEPPWRHVLGIPREKTKKIARLPSPAKTLRSHIVPL